MSIIIQPEILAISLCHVETLRTFRVHLKQQLRLVTMSNASSAYRSTERHTGDD